VGFQTEVEVAVPLVYDQTKLGDVGYRIDILVAGELVIEVKALETIAGFVPEAVRSEAWVAD
jgi:hypothetical protein